MLLENKNAVSYGVERPARPGWWRWRWWAMGGLMGVALGRTSLGLAPVELLDAWTLGYLGQRCCWPPPAVAAAAVTTQHRHAPSTTD